MRMYKPIYVFKIHSQNSMNHYIWISPCNVNKSNWVVAIFVLKPKVILFLDFLHGKKFSTWQSVEKYCRLCQVPAGLLFHVSEKEKIETSLHL